MMARGDQMHRQWAILHRLKKGRCSRRALADEFNVSLKTIARDIDTLSIFPITEEHEGIDVFYQMMEGTSAPGLRFEAEEIASLVFARGLVSQALEDTPYKDAFEALLGKLERHQRGHTHRKLERLPEVYRIYTSSSRTIRRFEDNLLDELIEAALQKRQVWMKYFTVYRQTLTERVVEPFVIYQSPHNLRLIAYCQMRQSVRFFTVNQIREIRVLDTTFDIEEKRFDLEQLLSESFDDMASGPIIEVRLHIRNPTAHWARDRNYHPTQVIKDVEDGIELSFRAGGMSAIVARVLGLGPDCRVLEPPELKHKVAERARTIASLHEDA